MKRTMALMQGHAPPADVDESELLELDDRFQDDLLWTRLISYSEAGYIMGLACAAEGVEKTREDVVKTVGAVMGLAGGGGGEDTRGRAEDGGLACGGGGEDTRGRAEDGRAAEGWEKTREDVDVLTTGTNTSGHQHRPTASSLRTVVVETVEIGCISSSLSDDSWHQICEDCTSIMAKGIFYRPRVSPLRTRTECWRCESCASRTT